MARWVVFRSFIAVLAAAGQHVSAKGSCIGHRTRGTVVRDRLALTDAVPARRSI
jgi:hypothetical protein